MNALLCIKIGGKKNSDQIDQETQKKLYQKEMERKSLTIKLTRNEF